MGIKHSFNKAMWANSLIDVRPTIPPPTGQIFIIKNRYHRVTKINAIEDVFDENEWYCVKVTWVSYWDIRERLTATMNDWGTRWQTDAVAKTFKFINERDRTMFLLKWQ